MDFALRQRVIDKIKNLGFNDLDANSYLQDEVLRIRREMNMNNPNKILKYLLDSYEGEGEEAIAPEEILSRTASSSISDQGQEGTCVFHATTRLIVKFIRNIVDVMKNPGNSCDDFYVMEREMIIRNMSTILYKRDDTELNSAELNYMFYVFIFSYIKPSNSSSGAQPTDVLDIVKRLFSLHDYEGTINEIFEKYIDIEDENVNEKMFMFKELYSYFLDQLKEKGGIDYQFFDVGSSSSSSQVVSSDKIEPVLIRFLNEGYYVLASFPGHTIVIVNYNVSNKKFQIKNSWGKITRNLPQLHCDTQEGSIYLTLQEMLDIRIDKFTFVYFNDSDLGRLLLRSVFGGRKKTIRKRKTIKRRKTIKKRKTIRKKKN